MARSSLDVVVVGAGPNGLAAAVALAGAGLAVHVVEAGRSVGGGSRTGPATAPGFLHDHCSTVHPLGLASPFLKTLPLERHGLRWVDSPTPLAHVLDHGRTVALERSLAATCARLGDDGEAYERLLSPFVKRFDELLEMILAPLAWPAHPVLLARFGLRAMRSYESLADAVFSDAPARALLAGIAAHAMLRLDAPATASFALVLAAAGHAVGWPIARGGSQAIADALTACLAERGGTVEVDHEVRSLHDLPRARAYVLDLTPRQVVAIAGDRLPAGYRRRLARYRYGPGVFKMDWALDRAIPWRDPICARAVTVHLSGDVDEVAAAEAAVHDGRVAERPFVLLVQPTIVDETRAPPGQHVAWAYCHVPHGSRVDASAAIEAHIERFAPGFRASILARATRDAMQMQAYNANYVGGDINGGSIDVTQLFTRPIVSVDPYATPAADVFLCSSATPPGGGVHGMCGYHAARSVLRRVFGKTL
jgi:phytoene dehydrogenase-like protein